MVLFLLISILFLNPIRTELCKNTKQVFTECTDSGSDRWAVYVPLEEGCSVPNPVKVASCDKTCARGAYLNGSSNCEKCPTGHYSYGDEEIYTVLDKIKHPEVNYISSKINQADKSKCSTIRVEEATVLVLPTDLCWYIVTIPVTLLQPGTVKLQYIVPDQRLSVVFSLVDANTMICNSDNKRDEKIGEISATWTFVQFDIPQKGRYLMEVKSTAYFNADPITDESVPISPARLGKLTVKGVKPITKCKTCPPGHIAHQTGTYECTPCPENTYTKDSLTCLPCLPDQYSVPGSGACIPRLSCSQSDYTVDKFSDCVKGKTTITEVPKINNKCLNTDSPTQSFNCSICSPGTELNPKTQSCDFCPDGMVSKNGEKCVSCEPNFISLKGLYYTWWGKVPAQWLLTCPRTTSECWKAVGGYLLGKSTNSETSIISLPEVHYSKKSITSEVAGLFSVKFTLECPTECSFLVVQETSYTGRDGKIYKRNIVKRRFKSPETDREVVIEIKKETNEGKFHLHLSGKEAAAKIYEIHYTNTAEGGAKHCFPCKGSGCLECGSGMISKEDKCVACPANTYHLVTGSILKSDYSSTCEPCGPGSISSKGSTSCYAPCLLTTPTNNTYQLTDLITFDQPDSFPDNEGNTFHYRYNMKLCSKDGTVPLVDCTENGEGDLKTQICQVNVVTDIQGNTTITHPTSKGDTLANITELSNGVRLQYKTLHKTGQCDSVLTNVTLLCNRDNTASDFRITQHDACSISFEQSGPSGCKKCRDSDYTAIISACVDGHKNITYVLRTGVVCSGGITLPPMESSTCTVYEDTLIHSIKRFKLFMGLGVGAVLLLIVGLCFLAWYSTTLKHQLEGYSRMSDGKENGYLGQNNDTLQFDWEDSDGADDEDLFSKSAYKPPTPGAALIQKISNLNRKIGMRKYKNLDNNVDLLQMPSNVGI